MWKWYTLLSFQSEAAIAALKAEVAGTLCPSDPVGTDQVACHGNKQVCAIVS